MIESERMLMSAREAYEETLRSQRNTIINKIKEAINDGYTYVLIDYITRPVLVEELKQKGYSVIENFEGAYCHRVSWIQEDKNENI